MTSAGPRSDPAASFAAAMAKAAPFEATPHLAIALSGGADSTALALIARDWVVGRGGRVTALTLDHGLRAGSAEEARAVAAWCATRGIAHETLRWDGAKPARAIQEKARQARYALLEAWCRRAGILHLLLGHHADDQRETIAMRAAKGSGDDGLAGMALISERTDIRLLRPLLAVDRDALRAWLSARGETWLEDPSNRDPRFLRSRLRTTSSDAAPARRMRVPRAASESWRAEWLGRHAAIHPEGWVSYAHAAFARLTQVEAAGLLRAGVMTVAGAEHPPRGRALAAATAWARQGPDGASRNFHGCLLLLVDAERLAILRNPAACHAVAICDAETTFDRRFRVRHARPMPTGSRIIPLREAPSGTICARRAPALRAAASLPATQGVDGSVCVFHVLYGRGSLALVSVDSRDVSFRPIRPLAGAAFVGPEAAEELSSTPESLARPERSEPRLPERVVPP
jgi:tRNA(Ile)-lysidine synthase